MADNLESYFKKHLTDENPGEDNWNVPSEGVWDNVLPVIQKKRGLFIPWKYFYLLGGVLLAGLLLLLFWPSSNEEIISSGQYAQTEKQGNVTHAAKDLDQTGQINDDAVSSDLSEATPQTISPSEAEKLSETETSSTTILVAQKTNPERRTNQQAFGKTVNQTESILPSGNSHRKQAKLSADDERSHVQIAHLSSLPVNTMLSEDSLFLPNTRVADSIHAKKTAYQKKNVPFNNKGKIGLGVFFAPTLTSTFIKGEPGNGIMETGNVFLYSGNWGFELKYHLSNRFTLVTGIEKSEIKSWSKSLVDFGYDSSNEHLMENGEKQNTSAVPMPTPFGEINTALTYRFPGEQQIPDGEMMQSVLETHQEVRYLSIPLGLEFNIIRFSSFTWFAEAGLRYNRALKDATEFHSRVLHAGDDMKVVAEEMTSHPGFTENYLNFYVGSGLNYQFSKSFQLNASARYFGNITHVNLQDNMSTYVQGFSLKIGIVYLF